MTISTRTRSVALVGAMTGERRAFHTGGHQAISPEKMLPIADVLLIVADDDPGAMLYRYTAHAEFGGDTWHASVEDARAQAAFEYGEALLLPWMDVPDEVVDAHLFATEYARERLNDRGPW
jgi:hypothetical protein